MSVLYSVTAVLPNPEIQREYIQWLTGGHIQAVIRGGAESAMLVELTEPGDALGVTVHYRFPSAEALTRYMEVDAPVLRAEGVSKFGTRGVTWKRTIGRVVVRIAGSSVENG